MDTFLISGLATIGLVAVVCNCFVVVHVLLCYMDKKNK